MVGREIVDAVDVVKQRGVALGLHIVKDSGYGVGQGQGFAENALYSFGDHGVERCVGAGVEATEQGPGLCKVVYDSHERYSPAMMTNWSMAWAR